MNIEDKHINNIISKDTNQNVSVPSWNSMSSSVKKQNFFTFGFLHVNIYSLSLLLLFLLSTFFGYKHFAFNNKSEIILKEIQVEVTTNKIQKPESPIVFNDTLSSNETIDQEPLSKKTVQKKLPIELEKTSLIDKSKTEGMLHDKTIETSKPITDIKQTITPSKPKGKTFIVYETDTVIKYDTLKVDKKRKIRK